MHEMALMASMLEIIQEQARQEGFSRVTQVTLEIGRLSAVEPEAMRFAFEVGTQDSVAEGATLVIQETPGLAHCPVCDLDVPVAVFYDPCPTCGAVPLEIRAGRDMKLLSLDVE